MQEFDPVFDAVFGEHENYLFKLFLCNPSLLRDCPELRFQLVAIGHVVVQISPDHQRSVAAHPQAAHKFCRHFRDKIGSSSAIYEADHIVPDPRSNPCRSKSPQKGVDENWIDALTAFPLVKANDLSTASHEPTPSR